MQGSVCGAAQGAPRMLVVTSNWSIADGTLYGGPPPASVAEFCEGVQRGVLRAGFRRDGSYRPVDRVDLVLAGDTGDWLVSGRWTDRVRPWHGGHRAAAVLERVAADSLRRGGRLLTRLSQLARHGVAVPPADPRRRPLLGARHVVPLSVTVLAGDRDPWLEQVSAVSPSARPGFAVGSTWSGGGVVVCHGAEHDPLCWAGNLRASHRFSTDARSAGFLPLADRQPSLAESLAVDLLARFGGSLGERRGTRPLVAPLLRAMAAGRLVDMPLRLAGRLRGEDGAELDRPVRRFVVAAWRRAVAGWHREARRQAPFSETEFDGVEHLAAWLDRVDDGDDTDGGDAACAGSGSGLLDPQVTALQPEAFAPEEAAAGPPSLTVLGHPPMNGSSFPTASIFPAAGSPVAGSKVAGPQRVLCLGPAPLRRSCFSAALEPGNAVDVSLIGPSGRPGASPPATVLLPDVDTGREAHGGPAGAGSAHGRPGIRQESPPWENALTMVEWIGADGDPEPQRFPAAGGRHPFPHRIVDAA